MAAALVTVLGAGIVAAVVLTPSRGGPAAGRPSDDAVRAYVLGGASPTASRLGGQTPHPPGTTATAPAPSTLASLARPPGAGPANATPTFGGPPASRSRVPGSPTRRPGGSTGGHPSRAAKAAPSGGSSGSSIATVTAGVPASPGSSRSAHGWITTADAVRRLAPLTATDLTPGGGGSETVTVNPSARYQTLAGTGAALTESSAHLLMLLPPAVRQATLERLFDPATGAGISLLRLPLGASDFALSAYSYDDNPPGGTDPRLGHEDVSHDDAEIVPIIQAALAVNPSLTVVATPWSAPAWMKTSGSLDGGSLISGDERLYAQYLVVAVAELRARGIPITALTVDDEPENTNNGNSPTMPMQVTQEATVVTDTRSLLSAKGMSDVRILGYDHNWSDPSYPEGLLADPGSADALSGTAWHCYGGDPSAQLAVENLHPNKEIWETECSGGDFAPTFATNLAYNVQTLGITGTRDGSRSVLLWNLALDPADGPHDGGCDDCRGVLTVDPSSAGVTNNVEYDVLALLGRTTRPGASRLDASQPSGIGSVAWQNTDGSRSVLLDNTNAAGSAAISVTVTDGTVTSTVRVPGGAAVSLAWG